MLHIGVTFILIILLSVSGCSWKPPVGSPWKQKLLREGPPGPPKFKMGWKDGCETGISATSNLFQKHFYTFKQQYEYARDPVYYTAWKISFMYCQRYVFQHVGREYL